MTTQAKLEAARKLIQQKNYREARAILTTIKDDPTAARWIAEIDRRKTTGSRRGMVAPIIIVAVLAGMLGYMVGVSSNRTSTPTRAAVAPTTEVRYTPTNTGMAIMAVQPASTQAATTAAPSTLNPSATITNTLTPSQTASPTVNLSLTAQSAFVEGTQTAHVRNLEATVVAWTRNAPTPLPPFTPLTFNGTTDQVLGPITLPRGMYRARVTTAGYFIAGMQVTSGECGTGTIILYPSLFNLSRGRGLGAEVVIRSAGCSTYIETSNITDGWTLEITRIS